MSKAKNSPREGIVGLKGESFFEEPKGKDGGSIRGKTLAVIKAVVKNVKVAMIDRGERRETPQRKWPLYRRCECSVRDERSAIWDLPGASRANLYQAGHSHERIDRTKRSRSQPHSNTKSNQESGQGSSGRSDSSPSSSIWRQIISS